MSDEKLSVSLPFFAAVVKALVKNFGDREAPWERMEEIRQLAARLEAVYVTLPGPARKGGGKKEEAT